MAIGEIMNLDESRTSDGIKIVDFLKDGPLEATEIQDKLDRDPSQFYKIIGRLERSHRIKIAYRRSGPVKAVALCYLPDQQEELSSGKYGIVYFPIEITVRVKPLADTKHVLNTIARIDDALQRGNWDLCSYWLNELRTVTINRRTGDISELLDALERYVDNSQLFEEQETRKILAAAIWHALDSEPVSGTTETRNEVISRLSNSARKIALKDRGEACRDALRFLGETEDRESIDVLVTILSQYDEVEYRRIFGRFPDDIFEILYNSSLGKKQREYVQERLAELLTSQNESARALVRRLQEIPRFYS